MMSLLWSENYLEASAGSGSWLLLILIVCWLNSANIHNLYLHIQVSVSSVEFVSEVVGELSSVTLHTFSFPPTAKMWGHVMECFLKEHG